MRYPKLVLIIIKRYHSERFSICIKLYHFLTISFKVGCFDSIKGIMEKNNPTSRNIIQLLETYSNQISVDMQNLRNILEKSGQSWKHYSRYRKLKILFATQKFRFICNMEIYTPSSMDESSTIRPHLLRSSFLKWGVE